MFLDLFLKVGIKLLLTVCKFRLRNFIDIVHGLSQFLGFETVVNFSVCVSFKTTVIGKSLHCVLAFFSVFVFLPFNVLDAFGIQQKTGQLLKLRILINTWSSPVLVSLQIYEMKHYKNGYSL